jgi:sterol 3beta-glucosyltransferase
LPLAIDQFFWGERIQKLGVGLSIPQRKLNPENLAQAITETLNNKDMNAKAKAISNVLNQEDGIKSAVTQIRKLL